jgi:hypothetical protein
VRRHFTLLNRVTRVEAESLSFQRGALPPLPLVIELGPFCRWDSCAALSMTPATFRATGLGGLLGGLRGLGRDAAVTQAKLHLSLYRMRAREGGARAREAAAFMPATQLRVSGSVRGTRIIAKQTGVDYDDCIVLAEWVSGSGSSGGGGSGWECSECAFVNPQPHALVCEMCGESKVGGVCDEEPPLAPAYSPPPPPAPAPAPAPAPPAPPMPAPVPVPPAPQQPPAPAPAPAVDECSHERQGKPIAAPAAAPLLMPVRLFKTEGVSARHNRAAVDNLADIITGSPQWVMIHSVRLLPPTRTH